ncbi:MAG: helix-hairpin-helix domain-containing protein [Ginsengibacter sp.]
MSKYLATLSKLTDMHGADSFKFKTYSIAAYKIEQLTVGPQTLSSDKIVLINGIGNAIGNKII